MVDGKRIYTAPTGERFPSVTTVLGDSDISDNSWLEEWHARVGVEEATRVSNRAKTRGTAIHKIAEDYLRNDPNYADGHMPFNLIQFNSVKRVLDARIGTIYGLEMPLWSSRLKTAGRTDLVAEWSSIPSIVDYKTSSKKKEDSDILSYFVQMTTYSLMLEEQYGLKTPQIVVVMAVDFEPEAQVFVKKRSDYVEKVLDVFVRSR